MEARAETPASLRLLELALILAVGFGYFIHNSVAEPVAELGPADPRDLVWVIAYELAAAMVIAVALGLRGWRRSDLPFRLGFGAFALAAALLLALYVLNAGLWSLWLRLDLPLVGPSFALSEERGEKFPLGLMLLISLMNGLYEEIILIGCCAAVAARPHVGSAPTSALAPWLLLGFAVRLSFHTYQGPFGVAQVALFGALVTASFLWTRNLAPAALAHIAGDALALIEFTD